MTNTNDYNDSFKKKYVLKILNIFARACFVAILMIGCRGGHGAYESDIDAASVNGDEKGTFYSLTVLHRFETGFNAETTRGKEIYFQVCSICHGDTGDGKGFNAYNLKTYFNVQPFNFTDTAGNADKTFTEILNSIAHGGPAVNQTPYMPPWGNTYSEYDIYSVTCYVWQSLMKKNETSRIIRVP